MDYKEVLRGKAPDIVLNPHDIVYVPFTPYRSLTRYLDLVLQTFVRTVGAIYSAVIAREGGRSSNQGLAIEG